MTTPIVAVSQITSSGVNQGAVSVDGGAVTWTTEPMPENANTTGSRYTRVAWSKSLGLFCAVAFAQGNNLNGIATLPDGVTWTGRSNGPASGFNDICWSPDKGIFVAVGNNTIWTSSDGTNWNSRTSPEANNWSGVAWSSSLGLFAMVSPAGTHQVATSPDGIIWTNQTGSTVGCTTIAWDPVLAIFCAIGATSGHTSTSSNGTVWADNNGSAGLSTFTYYGIASDGQGHFMVVGGNSGQVAISSNGTTTWTRTNSVAGGSSNMQEVIWSTSASLWVAAGCNAIATAPAAGTAWTTRTITAQNWIALAEGVAKSPPGYGTYTG